MAVAPVYYAEHYVIDTVASWALAASVMIGCSWWERRARSTDGPGEETDILRPPRQV
jgi:hypothetical protein